MFQRVLVPKDMVNIEGIEYENVYATEVYKNDRHIDENDKNMETVLNFEYKKTDDDVLDSEDQQALVGSKSKKLYNYEEVPYYNSARP